MLSTVSVALDSAIYVSALCACWPALYDRMSALQVCTASQAHVQSYLVLLLCHATHACNSKTISNLSTAYNYNIPSYIAPLRPNRA